jgi:PDZ domain
MGARLSISLGAILISLLAPAALADSGQFGSLDFARMTKAQEQYFWKRLKVLAFEEAIITYCGQPDDFEKQARAGIQSCVTADALNKADAFYRTELKSSLDSIRARRASCAAQPQSVRGWLGVEIQPMSKDAAGAPGNSGVAGVLVASTFDNSTAAAAGVQAGDVITSVNGETIGSPKELTTKIERLAPGTDVQLGVQRDGAGRTLSAKLGAMAFDHQGKIAFDMPDLMQRSRKDLKYVAEQVTEMCGKCSTSIWAMFCH